MKFLRIKQFMEIEIYFVRRMTVLSDIAKFVNSSSFISLLANESRVSNVYCCRILPVLALNSEIDTTHACGSSH